MDIKKQKKVMLNEKEILLSRYKITEEYLIERISEGEDKKTDLIDCQKIIGELENIIKFLAK